MFFPALRGYVLERLLSIHRLLVRRQHRRNDQGSGSERSPQSATRRLSFPATTCPAPASPVSNKTELASFRDMLVSIRANVAKLKQQGRSLNETTAAKPTAAFDAKWGQFLITPAFFTKLVYEGV